MCAPWWVALTALRLWLMTPGATVRALDNLSLGIPGNVPFTGLEGSRISGVNEFLKFCRRQGWHVICALKSNRTLNDKKLLQWPQTLRHQRYQRVQLPATAQRPRTSRVRTLRGKLSNVPFAVCVLISQRHPRDRHPQDLLCTDLTLTAQQILPIYQKRWPMEVDNFYVKQQWGLADFRVQSYETIAKWCAMVFLA